MNFKIAVGITIGLLAGVWTAVSIMLALPTWAAFITWALFFAAGGTARAVIDVLAPAATGVIYGVAAIAAATAIGGAYALPVAVAVIAFLMCVQALWSPLGMIPAAFAGCAALFGGAGDWLGIGIALLCGALLGWLSAWTAALMTRQDPGQDPDPAAAPAAQPAT